MSRLICHCRMCRERTFPKKALAAVVTALLATVLFAAWVLT